MQMRVRIHERIRTRARLYTGFGIFTFTLHFARHPAEREKRITRS